MITVRLSGGLGNQMFQYAAGRALAARRNTQLALDTSWFDPANQASVDAPRSYELGVFQLGATSSAPTDPAASSLRHKLSRLLGAERSRVLVEQHYEFDPRVIAALDGTILDGYWQSERYFTDQEASIRTNFSWKPVPDKANEDLLREMHLDSSVSLHVRRSDYVANKTTETKHGATSLGYYDSAVVRVHEFVRQPQFYVFSDDIAWCKEMLSLPLSTIFVDHNNGVNSYEDMRLMSACRHHIIANSSFSWWGAWLDDRPDKVVIGPKQWFADTSINTSDVLPESWLKL